MCRLVVSECKKIDLGIVSRESLLSAILVSMENAFEGNGMVGSQVGSFGSAVLHGPGMQNVLFLVYIPRSRMGFRVVVHVILVSVLTFPQSLFLTNSFMHPWLFCSKSRSVLS